MYASVAGVLVFMGEKHKRDLEGVMFYNKVTGQKVKPSMTIHLKYFFMTEERNFGVILVICMVMGEVLMVFLGYHLNLAYNNKTTNESFKRDEFKF